MDENEKNDIPMVPKYWAETMMMHMSRANKRLFIAVLAVCITSILTIIIFVSGYTTREKNRLDAWTQSKTPAAEVQNGIQQQPNDPYY